MATLSLGTKAANEENLLRAGMPPGFRSMKVSGAIDYLLRREYEGQQAQVAASLKQIVSKTSWGGLVKQWTVEVNGQPARPSHRLSKYLPNDITAETKADIRVSAPNGGGRYEYGNGLTEKLY